MVDKSKQDGSAILHIDMDAFFAAVEQRDRPELRGKCVLVGGSPTGRGVVSTASYEARPYGCRSAMPMAEALRRCPHAVVLPVRMDVYAKISREIRTILERFTPLIEPLSIDEAFLDVSGSTRLFGSPVEIATAIKKVVYRTTQLTASVGVAPNKFVAKLASDHDKPDGLVVVTPESMQAFLDGLPIGRLWGVGKATLPVFDALGVRTFADARALPLETLTQRFGDVGEHFYRLVRGIDDRPVVPDHEAKSISHEVTFAQDVTDAEHLRGVLLEQCDHVAQRLRRSKLLARAVVLKVRRPDFRTFTRRVTLASPTDRTDLLWKATVTLFAQWRHTSKTPVRLIGVGVTQLSGSHEQQLALFGQQDHDRRRELDKTVDAIRRRFGRGAVTRGGAISDTHGKNEINEDERSGS